MGKCNCTPLVIENHAVHKINCSTMTAQPDNTIDSEIESTLVNLLVGPTCTPSSMCTTCKALVKDCQDEIKTAAHAITEKIAQEANKAKVDEVMYAFNFGVIGKEYMKSRISELTADKEKA